MKGLELPVNMIIIIAIAVLVLVVVSAFFAGQFGGGVNSISVENAFANGCAALRSAYSCDPGQVGSVKVNGYKETANDQNQHSLGDICIKKSIDTADGGLACARACGCQV